VPLQCVAVTPPSIAPSHSLTLVRHPACPPGPVEGVDATIAWGQGALRLRYRLRGDLVGVVIPAAGTPARRDELWRHTCFEVFLRRAAQGGYAEFNFSPSGEWAAYRFDAYRQGMRALELPAVPAIEARRDAGMLEIQASVMLPAPWDAAPVLQAAVTAVVEASDGTVSYWSLAHPAGKPDFHHGDGFVVELE